MATLVDSNILLRSLYPHHQHYSAAKRSIATLERGGEILCVAPQNLVEFWAVATRPRGDNGLGLTPARAAGEIATLRQVFNLLPWTPDVLDAGHVLVAQLGVSGRQTHDAHLVAVMKVHDVGSVLTFNVADFRRYPGIQVLDPSQF